MTGGIQWPVQFHRDERMASRMVTEHHTVGVQSTMTREEFLTLRDKFIVEAAEAWEGGYEDMALGDAAFDLLTLRLVTAVRMKRGAATSTPDAGGAR